ncbi:MAG: radical SAM family heme chaperone HemW [Pseudomonadota bacterium]
MNSASVSTAATLTLPPLSIYVHIPWCERKCPYCDFNSHESASSVPETEYVDALIRDLDASLHWVQDRAIETIFVGGGTPSLFSADAIRRLLKGIGERVDLSPDCEITLEANPGSAETERFAGYAGAGVNRLSLGIQSFQQQQLEALGRVHNSEQAAEAVELALSAGFNSVNIDLMHGLPDQGEELALADLETAIGFGTQHLSWYQLTIEPNTAFYKQAPELPVEDTLADIQVAGEARIASAGFDNYEVSAYAMAGISCRHNLNYWTFGDYIGIGAGAHGKLTRPERGEVVRTTKRRQPQGYLACQDAQNNPLDEASRLGDFMLNALRLTEGFHPELFTGRTGLSANSLLPIARELEAQGLLSVQAERIATTDLGRRFLDTVVAEFL